MKPSELTLPSPRRTALYVVNPCGVRSMWMDTGPFPHPRRSPQSGSAGRSRRFIAYVSRLLCQALLGTVVSQPMSARLYRGGGPALWTHNLFSPTQPHTKQRSFAWFNALLLPCETFFNKGPPFLFCIGPTNYVGSPDREAACLRAELHRGRELYLFCLLDLTIPRTVHPTL